MCEQAGAKDPEKEDKKMVGTACIKRVASFVMITGLIQSAIAEDDPANFRGMVKVISSPVQTCRSSVVIDRSLEAAASFIYTWYAAGISESLPDLDFVSRFHLLLMPENPGTSAANVDRYLDLVRVSAT